MEGKAGETQITSARDLLTLADFTTLEYRSFRKNEKSETKPTLNLISLDSIELFLDSRTFTARPRSSQTQFQCPGPVNWETSISQIAVDICDAICIKSQLVTRNGRGDDREIWKCHRSLCLRCREKKNLLKIAIGWKPRFLSNNSNIKETPWHRT